MYYWITLCDNCVLVPIFVKLYSTIVLQYFDSCMYWCLAYICEGTSAPRIHVTVASSYPPGGVLQKHNPSFFVIELCRENWYFVTSSSRKLMFYACQAPKQQKPGIHSHHLHPPPLFSTGQRRKKTMQPTRIRNLEDRRFFEDGQISTIGLHPYL